MSVTHIGELAFPQLPWWWHEIPLFQAIEGRTVRHEQIRIVQLIHEMVILKRWSYSRTSEKLDGPQRDLLEETIDADPDAACLGLDALLVRPRLLDSAKHTPERASLPKGQLRTEMRHEPETTVYGCGCTLERIGEENSEKFDYIPLKVELKGHDAPMM